MFPPGSIELKTKGVTLAYLTSLRTLSTRASVLFLSQQLIRIQEGRCMLDGNTPNLPIVRCAEVVLSYTDFVGHSMTWFYDLL